MAKVDNTAHIARYAEIRAEVTKATGLTEGARFNYLTIMMVKLEQLGGDVLLGKNVSPNDLLALRQCVEEMSPMPPAEPLKVELVHNIGCCPECGFEGPEHYCSKCHGELTTEDLAAIDARDEERRTPDRRSKPMPSPAATETPPIAAKPAAPTPPPASDGAPRTRSIHDGNSMVKNDPGEGGLCWVGGSGNTINPGGAGGHFGSSGGTPDLSGRF